MSIDILITGGRIVDGTGNPWCYGDIAIRGDRIAAITPPGQIPPMQAREIVDARGMVVCPGFIDIQSHSILPDARWPVTLQNYPRRHHRDYGRGVDSRAI